MCLYREVDDEPMTVPPRPAAQGIAPSTFGQPSGFNFSKAMPTLTLGSQQQAANPQQFGAGATASIVMPQPMATQGQMMQISAGSGTFLIPPAKRPTGTLSHSQGLVFKLQ